MPLREHALLCPPILEYLRGGKRPSWEIEDELARQFNVTDDERAQIYAKTGMSVWTNDVAFALKRLGEEVSLASAERLTAVIVASTLLGSE